MKAQTINFSNDLGNGTVKGIMNGKGFKMPSNVVHERPQDVHDPEQFTDQIKQDSYMKNYRNHMDVSIQSSAIRHGGRYLVGQSAINSGLDTQGFDVSDMSGKAETDLAIILTLSAIAGQAVENAYKKGDKIPGDEIKVNVNMVTALPIMEGTNNHTTDYYRKRYTSTDHIVSVLNFANPIVVKIHFTSVHVTLEGQAAIYAIRHSTNPALKRTNFADLKKHFPALAKRATSYKQIAQEPNIMGIDIGEGTTDLAVFKGGVINLHASSSTPSGYGNVLNGAVTDLQQHQVPIRTRAQIREVMSQPAGLFSNKDRVKQAIHENEPNLIDDIRNAMSEALRKVGYAVHLIYIYGGGSIPMEPDLRKPLEIKTRAFNGGKDIPIIFINKKFAQDMNVMGLQVLLNALK